MSTMHPVQWVTKTLDWWILPTIQRGINTDPSHTLPKNRREGSTAAHSARSAPPRCDADKGTRFTREGGTCFSPSPLLRLWLPQAQGKERVETERSVTAPRGQRQWWWRRGRWPRLQFQQRMRALTGTRIWLQQCVSVKHTSLMQALAFPLLWVSQCCGHLKRINRRC